MLAALAAARFTHLLAVTLLFGVSAYPLYAQPDASARRRLSRWLDRLAALALATGILTLLVAAANMGGGPASLLDVQVLQSAVLDTDFGRIWAARLAWAALLVAARFAARRLGRPQGDLNAGALSVVLLASLALTGHSAMQDGAAGVWIRVAGAVHLIAAGWWVGGLLALTLTMGTAPAPVLATLRRFSWIGYGAVTLIILTGGVKSLVLGATPASLVTTPYGRALAVKLAAAAGMAGLALSNRFWITPALADAPDGTPWLRRLRLQASAELALGVAAMALVGVMGALPPPVST